MYRYIALIWNAEDTKADATADFLSDYFNAEETIWEVPYDGAGMRVLQTGGARRRMQAYPLYPHQDQQGGVVLGKLLHKARRLQAISQNADFTVPEARQVLQTEGQCLAEDYWGAYVAFFQTASRKYILVDPMGGLGCFCLVYRGVEIYFSALRDMAACDFIDLSVDWTGVAQKLNYGQGRTDVPINGVSKILPGQRLVLTPDGRRANFCWDPQQIAQSDIIYDMDQAVALLRHTILDTVAALAAPYSRIVQSIGGLDSSILLACLRQAPSAPELFCINQYGDSREGDERYFVRKTVAHMDVPLVEYQAPPVTLDFQTLSEMSVTSTPPFYLFLMQDRRVVNQYMTDVRAEVMFNGFGGDEILYAHGFNFGPIDYIKLRGLRPGLVKVIMEAARMQRRSVWAILPEIIRGLSGPESVATQQSSTWSHAFLTPEILALVTAPEQTHPWSHRAAGVPPGKFNHLSPLATGRFDREGFAPPEHSHSTLHPFLMQPVVEACLRIPVWLLLADGKGRGLARKAFQQDLPPEVVWRTSKSAIYPPSKPLIQENIDVIRGLMLEGEMVRGGFLRRDHLEDIMKNPAEMSEGDHGFLFYFLDMELWARKLKGETFADFIRSKVA
ncbi:asparagine synthase C-terminal domain-containing protein [Paremcibacter congregatus]|uniref:Asparagine synthetase domain-containing protein n=1 Tax=Paremcibacter congregatus TaxID=2043170 RepID=A0A2G4YQ28_9PROT|nr:asparagine synthase C-terminal domain-containing protein [Paremcibacter congregatus]PHZ83566.1 hypothetical protein CRD36_16505 [Paremcibacter congregatus]QDE28348.1 asparagine synthase [Paremcibacter congregatus]